MRVSGFFSDNISRVKFLLRALRYRNYRLFFFGQGVSLIGTWMQFIALSWLVYRLTDSAFLLGFVGFTGQIPISLLVPFAGVLADRLQRRRVLVVTQTLAMVQALLLAFLVLTGKIEVWHIIALSAFLGLVNAFDVPARQAFVVDIVEKTEDLGNAIALNSLLFNGARLIGPSVAGVLIATVGEGMCFLFNGLSFLAVIIALLAMDLKERTEQNDGRILEQLKEGFLYAWRLAPIRYILLLVSLVSLMGISCTVLMPLFAKDILGGGPETLGFLMAVVGIGALAGAGCLASRRDIRGLEVMTVASTMILGAGLAVFSFSRILWISMLSLLCVGFGMMVQMVSSNTLLQHITDDDKRGRVMSFYALAFLGVAPFGSLLAGGLAACLGAPNTVLISAFACIAGSLFFAAKVSSINKALAAKLDKEETHPI